MPPKPFRKILITAGPTEEPIDPVRVITNRSTGFMGYEIARAARKRGYRVTLISGPVKLTRPRGLKFIRVSTARELQRAVRSEIRENDILVMASAVSDFRPAKFSKNKVSSGKAIVLRLVKNPDILKSLSEKERKDKILVGFSLETGDLLKKARKKLKEKRLDLIVSNRAGGRSAPFGDGPTSVYLIDGRGNVKTLKNVSKKRVSGAILDTIKRLCYTRS